MPTDANWRIAGTSSHVRLKGEGDAGGAIAVTAPVPLETAGAPVTATAMGPQDLSDILGKKVLIRGRVHKEMQKGTGLTDVLLIEKFEVVEEDQARLEGRPRRSALRPGGSRVRGWRDRRHCPPGPRLGAVMPREARGSSAA